MRFDVLHIESRRHTESPPDGPTRAAWDLWAQEDTLNTCFICNIDRYTFDRSGVVSFEFHIKKQHNMWEYLAYMVPTHDTAHE